jgi:hypothetical protein
VQKNNVIEFLAPPLGPTQMQHEILISCNNESIVQGIISINVVVKRPMYVCAFLKRYFEDYHDAFNLEIEGFFFQQSRKWFTVHFAVHNLPGNA